MEDKIDRILLRMRRNPDSIRFVDAVSACTRYFGAPRQSGFSHVVFAMPWPGDPRVNLQNDRGMAKAYQVRQALKAIDRITEEQQ